MYLKLTKEKLNPQTFLTYKHSTKNYQHWGGENACVEQRLRVQYTLKFLQTKSNQACIHQQNQVHVCKCSQLCCTIASAKVPT